MSEQDLGVYPVDAIIEELKRRNLSFILAFVDHQQFTKDASMTNEVVWACDSGGNLALQETLLRFLTEWMKQVVEQRCQPGHEG